MNGAEIMVKTSLAAGIEICFSNPGTTELRLVAALDSVSGIRAVLGLFEGVCTGAADGYGRMSDKPAMILLHLGPGLSNGLAVPAVSVGTAEQLAKELLGALAEPGPHLIEMML